MSSESESSDLDRDVNASMRMFEKSKVGNADVLVEKKPARILLALDGSPQDETGLEAAEYLHDRFRSEVYLIDARERREGGDLAIAASEKIHEGRPLDPIESESYEAILQAVSEHKIDLVIVPCPFGRSFSGIGTDSVGTVIDVLLTRCPAPMLVVRRDDQLLSDCCGVISVVVGGECDVEFKAASWAYGLVTQQGTVTLNLVVEKEQYENIRSIVEAVTPDVKLAPEQFSEALTRTHQGLHAAMAKSATAKGIGYHLRPQAGEVAPPNPLQDSAKMLLIMPLEVDDRFGQGFVQDRIRRSPHPVLVVPGHVQQSSI